MASKTGKSKEFNSLLEQLAWLNMIKNHLIGELSINFNDLQTTPFQQKGGMLKARSLFGTGFTKNLKRTWFGVK